MLVQFGVLTELTKLKQAVLELQELVRWRSARLVQRLRQRDRMGRDLQHHCDVLTAFLQAISPKRRKYYAIIFLQSLVECFSKWDTGAHLSGSLISQGSCSCFVCHFKR